MNKRKLIAQSLDIQCYRHRILKGFGIFMFADILISILLFVHLRKSLIGTYLFCFHIVSVTFYASVVLLQAIQIIELLKRSNTYIFSEAVLSEYHASWNRFYFRLTITDEKGKILRGSTAPFYKAGSSIAGFEDWHGKKVVVAYDPEKEKMIVVGLSKNFRHITEANQPTNQASSD